MSTDYIFQSTEGAAATTPSRSRADHFDDDALVARDDCDAAVPPPPPTLYHGPIAVKLLRYDLKGNKRFCVPHVDQLTLDTVRSHMCVPPSTSLDCFILSYEDVDGDRVDVLTDADLLEAFRGAQQRASGDDTALLLSLTVVPAPRSSAHARECSQAPCRLATMYTNLSGWTSLRRLVVFMIAFCLPSELLRIAALIALSALLFPAIARRLRALITCVARDKCHGRWAQTPASGVDTVSGDADAADDDPVVADEIGIGLDVASHVRGEETAPFAAKVQQLTELGFPNRERIVSALVTANGNVENAVHALLAL